MALCTFPELLNDEKFPEDAKHRARRILNACGGGSVGAYTDSAGTYIYIFIYNFLTWKTILKFKKKGLEVVKNDIADFISRRDDGIPANSDDIFLTTGASSGIKTVMELLLNGPNEKPAGFMIPIPQYPLYSATISEYSAQQVSYLFFIILFLTCYLIYINRLDIIWKKIKIGL